VCSQPGRFGPFCSCYSRVQQPVKNINLKTEDSAIFPQERKNPWSELSKIGYSLYRPQWVLPVVAEKMRSESSII
jgi:hypothetical protein